MMPIYNVIGKQIKRQCKATGKVCLNNAKQLKMKPKKRRRKTIKDEA